MANDLLDKVFRHLGKSNPIQFIEEINDWHVCTLQGMQKPSTEAMQLHQQGFFWDDGGDQVFSVMKPEPVYFHGTDWQGGLNILCDKMFRVLVPHSPTGIYSYADESISAKSCYTAFGFEFAFSSYGVVLSLKASKHLDVVRPGQIARVARSEAKRSGRSVGCEHIHHPEGCFIHTCRINRLALNEMLSAVFGSPLPAHSPTLEPAAMAWWGKDQGRWGKDQGKDWDKDQDKDKDKDAWRAKAAGFSKNEDEEEAKTKKVMKMAMEVAMELMSSKPVAKALGSNAGPMELWVGGQGGFPPPPAVPPPAIPPLAAPPSRQGGFPHPEALHHSVIKLLICGSLGLRADKLRWCWKCYSMSWLSPSGSCLNGGCSMFGMQDVVAALSDKAELYVELQKAIEEQLEKTPDPQQAANQIFLGNFIFPTMSHVVQAAPVDELGDVPGALPKAVPPFAKGHPKGKGKGKGKAKGMPAAKAILAKAGPAKAAAKQIAKAKAKGAAKQLAKAKAKAPFQVPNLMTKLLKLKSQQHMPSMCCCQYSDAHLNVRFLITV